jgi:hypothetical protein
MSSDKAFTKCIDFHPVIETLILSLRKFAQGFVLDLPQLERIQYDGSLVEDSHSSPRCRSYGNLPDIWSFQHSLGAQF